MRSRFRRRRRMRRSRFRRRRANGGFKRFVMTRLRRLQGEMKHNDQDLTAVFLNVTATNLANTLTQLTDIEQGDTIDTRTGNSILIKSIFIQGCLQDQNTDWEVKFFLIQDRQQVADTTPTVGNIFEDADPAHPLLNRSTLGRFKILYSTRIYTRKSVESGDAMVIRMYKKCSIPVRYNGSATSDIQKNGIYWVTLYKNLEETGSHDWGTGSLMARLNYIDN